MMHEEHRNVEINIEGQNIGQLLRNIEYPIFSSNLRTYEKYSKKLINKECALSFNETCLWRQWRLVTACQDAKICEKKA